MEDSVVPPAFYNCAPIVFVQPVEVPAITVQGKPYDPLAIPALQSDVVTLQTQMTIANSNISSLEGDIVSIDNSLQTVDASIGSLTVATSANSNAISTTNTNVGTLQGQMATANTNISTNTSNIASNTTNIASNTTAISTTNGNVTALTTRVTTAEGNIATNTSNISANSSSIGGLNFSVGQITPGTTGSFVVGAAGYPAIQSVGADGTALIADSTQSTGVKWSSIPSLDSLGQNPLATMQRGWYPTVYGSWTFPRTITPFQGGTRDLIFTSGNNAIPSLGGGDYGGFRKLQLSGTNTQIRCANRPIYVEWLDVGAGSILSLVGGNGGSGNATAPGTGGTLPVAAQTFGGGAAGGAGSKTVGVSAAAYGFNTYMDPPTFAGGNGGLGASGAGGSASAGTAELGYSWTRPPFCWNITDVNGGKLCAGAGGGGGGGDGTNGGGGGGAGGGVILISARRITGTGTITVAGGNGGAATVGNCGGGGGGGGGLIVIHTPQDPATINLTFNVSGGTGGAKTGTGVAGGAGQSGAVIMFSGYNQTAWLS
jgi:hypothetical protein